MDQNICNVFMTVASLPEVHKVPGLIPSVHKLGVVVHTYDLLLRGWRQEHQKLKVIPAYVEPWRPR